MTRMDRGNIFSSFKIVLLIIALLWILLFISFVLPINQFGIRPRTLIGLPGIFLAPFLHENMAHLINNSIILLILGSIFLTMERKLSLLILIHFIILGGLGTWLIGRGGYVHIGASGVIYGILGYLLFLGIFTRNFKAIVVSIIVFILYGGTVWGIFPGRSFVSWESHLCGFISGIVTAKIYSKNRY